MIIEFYKKRNGEKPVKEFLDGLPAKLAAKTRLSIDLLRSEGYRLQMPFVEKLTDDIWELRTKQGSDITRICYFFFDGEKAILTNGFVKKTTKTPYKEIEKAKMYRQDYYRRKNHEK